MGFLDDMVDVPESVETRVWEKHALVESMPGVGSSLLSSTLLRRYGDDCLKLLVDPYEIVYRWGGGEDVDVLALVRQRKAKGPERMKPIADE